MKQVIKEADKHEDLHHPVSLEKRITPIDRQTHVPPSKSVDIDSLPHNAKIHDDIP